MSRLQAQLDALQGNVGGDAFDALVHLKHMCNHAALFQPKNRILNKLRYIAHNMFSIACVIQCHVLA